MENKRRNCKFDAIKSSPFCHYHSPNQDFIFCPIDNSHTILQSKLENHLKICPKLKYENSLKQSIWFSQGVNSKKEDELPVNKNNELTKKLLEKTPGKKKEKILIDIQEKDIGILINLIEKIDIAFIKALKMYTENLNDESFTSEYCMPQLKNPNVSVSKKQKDEKQLDFMLELMEKFKLLNEKYVYLEYGAGKGHLSHKIAVQNNDKSAHILLEKEPRRNKFDKHHRNNKNFIRLRTDITDFNINILPGILKEFRPEPLFFNVVGISKHMCGGATDLSLNSLFNLKEKSLIMQGVCIVTCCHHRCSVDTYCNIPFLLKLGFTIEEITIVFKMSSWALTAIYDDESNMKEEIEEIKEVDFPKIEEKKIKCIKSEKKTEIGFKIKRIIDIGRCMFVNETIFKKTFLMKYCELDLTPENFAIIFKKILNLIILGSDNKLWK